MEPEKPNPMRITIEELKKNGLTPEQAATLDPDAWRRFYREIRVLAERVRAARKWHRDVCPHCLPHTAEDCPEKHNHKLPDH